jgi:3-hydroxyacyl-CoA dehydrogenase
MSSSQEENMASRIRKVAVIGAGTMGSGIAAHVANAGLPCVLLDIVPPDLEGEARKVKANRDRFAATAVTQALKAKPPMLPFQAKRFAKAVTVGNLEDDLELLADCDLIVEAIVENLKIKRDLFQKIAKVRKPGAVVSSNTSGIAIASLVDGFDEEFQRHFLVTHFFNPPRFMRLLELVPGTKTSPEVLSDLAEFGQETLGKGIVYCKDTPNFIANRIGVMGMAKIFQLMEKHDLTVEEVDIITGPAMARPRTATYATADLVGLDVLDHIFKNSYEVLDKDETRELLRPPKWFGQLIENKAFGRKTKKGFYTRDGKTKLYLDWKTGEYKECVKPKMKSVGAAKKGETAAEKILALHQGEDKASAFAWDLTTSLFSYVGLHLDEIANDIVNVDNAMRWGFNWELGPFEVWDALGVSEGADRMKKAGLDVPKVVADLLEFGEGSWYVVRNGVRHYWEHKEKTYKPVPTKETTIDLNVRKAKGHTTKENDSASLVDLGDGVLCVEFHSKMNALDDDIIRMLHEALDLVESKSEYTGLVLGNHGANFSVGANVFMMLMYARQKQFEPMEQAIRELQRAVKRLRYSPKPVVAAPFAMALGGGCEVCLGADAICAHSELYMGLVELGVGLIPAGGGTTNTLVRWLEHIPDDMTVDRFPFIQKAFELIGMAQVSNSAEVAREYKFLRNTDRVVMDIDGLLHEAKTMVVGLATGGYRQPAEPHNLIVPGRPGLATFQMGLENMLLGKYITEYERHIAMKLANILTGGDVQPNSAVTFDHLLELECEAFMSLVGEAKTQERMQHMLMKGKPLRN